MPQPVAQFAAAWPMGFTSAPFLLFLPLTVGGYFLLRGGARRAWLLLASYTFYFFAAPRYLAVLAGGTLAAYLLGLFVHAAPAGTARRARCACSAALLVLGLAFFKYNAFFAAPLAPLFARFGVAYPQDVFIAASALGISYYTFMAIGYLVDVCRRDIPAERNLLDFALFLGFFGTVSMGPITRAGQMLPQLKDTARRFDANAAGGALVLMGIGFFKKLAVADTLRVYTAAVYGNLAACRGATLTLAAVAFAVQLYFDFSGYTDIVRAAASLLGIRLPENFQNPYYATNFSQFWARWHMSLSGWLQDYIFTPLVWSRWTEKLPFLGRRAQNPPVLSAIAAVFLVSGVWHGDTLCFLVWGALMALFRIGEELLHRALGKPAKKPGKAVRAGKTAVVLALWVESLVFFRVGMTPGGTAGQAAAALARQLLFISPQAVWQGVYGAAKSGFYADGRIAAAFLAFSLFCTLLGLWGDWWQCHRLGGGSLAAAITRQGAARRRLIYIGLALCCFAGFIAQSGGFGGGGFLYEGF